ncbi:Threonine-rich protein [Acropora cervicornis]|uniref:Threonine-rich protein n=1 Tax=Acropora cervicornis TaxID=6130 RepID=A0AAD9QWA0_ACRCE|nr:Threonine-rich protein [Acropora cervicornis]
MVIKCHIRFAYIVLTELAPHIGAVQRDSHMENLTCAECQGVTEINCTLGEREVQCNPGEVCTTLEAFNLDIGTTTVIRDVSTSLVSIAMTIQDAVLLTLPGISNHVVNSAATQACATAEPLIL